MKRRFSWWHWPRTAGQLALSILLVMALHHYLGMPLVFAWR